MLTNKEAIQILSTRDAHGVLCGYTSGVTEALDMAIDALKQTVSESSQERGKWVKAEDYDGGIRYQCDQCGDEIIVFDGTPEENSFNFCSNCGADMRRDGAE